MKTNRATELKASIKSFRKERYSGKELINEMFALQKEFVDLTFNKDTAELSNLRIWDVEKRLQQMNENCGHVADELLQIFNKKSKDFSNLLKAEFSGKKGEEKAFRTLNNIKSRNYVLKNVELSDGNSRTELDAIVVTPSAITIIEVKNTARNIFIDETGNYFRTGEFLRLDCNIGKNMQTKEKLLRKALASSGYGEVDITSVVVFTNNRIEVQNKFKVLKTCFINQLLYEIENTEAKVAFSNNDMDLIKIAIESAENKDVYPFKFDVEQYKTDFAILLATLEEAELKVSEKETIEDEPIRVKQVKNSNFKNILKNVFSSKYSRYTSAVAAAAFTVSLITTAATKTTIHKGGF